MVGLILGALFIGGLLGAFVGQFVPVNCNGNPCNEQAAEILKWCTLGGAAFGALIGGAANEALRDWLKKREEKSAWPYK